MRRSKVLCLALCAGLWASSSLVAQPTCTADPGSLRSIERALRSRSARIELADGTSYSPVREVFVTPEAVSGRLRGRPFEVPLSQVRRIDALAKRQPLARFLRGAAIGGGVGATMYVANEGSELEVSSSVIVGGAALGGVIGGIVGLTAPVLDEEVVCEPLARP